MNTQKLDRAVVDHLMRVRELLDDLDEETRTDLLEGLEADVAELVEERGAAALPSPERYAEELRAAAGLPARRGAALVRDRVRRHQQRAARPLDERFDTWCDRWRERFLSRAEGPRLAPVWGFLQVLRPAWWVLRGYLLVLAADVLTGPWEPLQLLPQLGVWMLGPALTVLAVAGSVQVGRGRLWPGTGTPVRVHARAALLALNLAALLAVIPVMGGASGNVSGAFLSPSASYVDVEGLRIDGKRICNLQPYDAQGRPLVGVQLFDQDGDRVTTSCTRWDDESRGHHLPWSSFGEDRWNVFPQAVRPSRRQDPALPEPATRRVAPVELTAVPQVEEVEDPSLREGRGGERSGDRAVERSDREPTRQGEDRRGTPARDRR